ncbi:non-cyanogenic beta-glucosidase-like precursor [Cicer arietinum]|uniref:Non-cyanogenic beta-glucosidase n=1 Tax=Cicer arietinum TaxID=3827 RepID=Q700B1_CICAR|nr:non-cyanogenic beta-glucosidase-like precursor [Cicer arietinum]CAG14979.1 non-cyanogenic beta-glucosidase [Cicer arietinum]
MIALFVVLSSFTFALTNADPLLDFGDLDRYSFPPGFIFGAGSSSYQVEGATFEDGKGESIWDNYTHSHPERILDGSNADVTVDQYHRYKEDIAIMKAMNMDSYRFSISWSRILPKGKLDGGRGINPDGIKYYNNLINELIANEIEPFVTLFHWDLPQALEDEYGGFLSSQIIDDFRDYADLCFTEFGDRVKYWATINEPWFFSNGGYAMGTTAPGRCSTNPGCLGGDSGTEPYIVTHNQLLAHGEAVNVYRTKYQEDQKGKIGITLVTNWFIPLGDNSIPDLKASERAMDFQFGWFMEPLTTGDYSKSMRDIVKNRLPTFKPEESLLVKDSFDFIGLNYYSSSYINNVPPNATAPPSYTTDPMTNTSFEKNGRPLGQRAASFWIYVYPIGLRDLLMYIKEKYNNPVIYIHENGMNEFNDPTLPIEEAVLDTYRIDYYYRHFYYMKSAIDAGANVKGYYAWSLLDSFEWFNGYTVRFGFYFVDYNDGLKRYQKLSANWYRYFLERRKHQSYR